MQRFTLSGVHSYRETGLRHTYERDLALADLLASAGVPWHEHQPMGCTVASDRKGWRESWFAHMSAPQDHPDWSRFEPVARDVLGWPEAWRQLPVPDEVPERFQPGGERKAHAYLETFVTDRIRRYARTISKAGGQPGRVQSVECVAFGATSASGRCTSVRKRPGDAAETVPLVRAGTSRRLTVAFVGIAISSRNSRWRTGWNSTM